MVEDNKNYNRENIDDLKEYLTQNENIIIDINKYVLQNIRQNKMLCNNILNNTRCLLDLISFIIENMSNMIKVNNTRMQLINTIHNRIKGTFYNNIDEDMFFSFLCILEYLKNKANKENKTIYASILDICVSILIMSNINNKINNSKIKN